MKLELQVIASTAIKRKKPWPRLAWIGEVQESVFLVDEAKCRLSVLYIPSGKTKRRITKLQPLLPHLSAFNHSQNGHFLVGVVQHGGIFIWHKDTNTLKYVRGLPVFNAATSSKHQEAASRLHIYISDTGGEVLVVPPGGGMLYFWEIGQGHSLLATTSIEVAGTWSLVKAPEKVTTPGARNTELCVSAVFMTDQVLGRSCSCSFIFSEGAHIIITSVLLRWISREALPYDRYNLRSDWSSVRYEHPDYVTDSVSVQGPGSLLARHTHDGHLLAVAVNRPSSHDNCMLYVSTLTDTVVVADMKGCGARNPISGHQARLYWVEEMQWTWDDLFLICMVGQGSMCILTRLGEPLMLQTYGHKLELGPHMFLPIHPLVTIQGTEVINDPLKQRYSITPHPRLPLFLCSDGYLVTAIQLPGEMSCLQLITGLTMEAATHLRQVRDQLKLTLNLDDHMESKESTERAGLKIGQDVFKSKLEDKMQLNYIFEAPDEDALDKTLDNNMLDLVQPQPSLFSQMSDHGKVVFGDSDNMVSTQEYLNQEGYMSVTEKLEKSYSSLSLAWSLCASHSGLWTQHHEDAARLLVHHTCKLISLILICDTKIIKELSTQHMISKKPRVTHALAMVKKLLTILSMDCSSGNLVVSSLYLAHNIIRAFLQSPKLAKREPRLHTLHGCFVLLTYIERTLHHIYHPVTVSANSHLANLIHVYEPSLYYKSFAKQADENTDNQADVRKDMGPSDKATYIAVKHKTPSIATPLRTQQLAHRMAPAWRLLYKHVVKQWKYSVLNRKKKERIGCLQHIMCALQAKLQAAGAQVSARRKCRVKPGKRFVIEGSMVPATQAWLQQLNKLKDIPERHLGHILHSILYTLLLQNDFRQAVEFVEILIRHENIQSAAALCRQDQQTKLSVLSLVHQRAAPEVLDPPPSYIQSWPVLQVVQSLGRFMAAYFANATIFVYPPHTPHKLPPLHNDTPIKGRITSLYSSSISSIIRHSGLSHVWTVERCIEYLVISGLLSEAVWLSRRLGDWKTAFLISSTIQQRAAWLKQEDYDEDIIKYYNLAEPLTADVIMKDQLQSALSSWLADTDTSHGPKPEPFSSTETEEMQRYLGDMLLASTIMGVSVTPWLLDDLVGRVKVLVSQFPALVPDGLYLPAPPLYCPQPALPSKVEVSEDVYSEMSLRQQVSQVIHCCLLALSASNCLLSSARWYLTRVLQAIQVAAAAKKEEFEFGGEDVRFLARFLEEVTSVFQGEQHEASIHDVLAAFRDICSLLWLLHARDQLSLCLRKKLKMIERQMREEHTVDEVAWESQCEQCLSWASHMAVFSQFLSGDVDIYGSLLSIIMELPAAEKTATSLALQLPDIEDLAPEVQDKLQVLLNSWKGVFLEGNLTPRGSIKVNSLPGKSPRGTPLSVFYQKQAKTAQQKVQNQQKLFGLCEPQVFATTNVKKGVENGINFIGARPFESEPDFLHFLDMFYAVSLNKEVEKVNQKRLLRPLLNTYTNEVRLQELNSTAYKAVSTLQKRNMDSSQESPFKLSISIKDRDDSYMALPPRSPRTLEGLFRSRSFNDASVFWGTRGKGPQMGLVVQRKAVSHNSIDSLGLETPRSLKEHYKSKLKYKSGSQRSLISQVSVPLQRSHSVDSQLSQEERAMDPLSKPLFSSALLAAMVFGKAYEETAASVEWLTKWSGKQHKVSLDPLTSSPAMHINMHSRIVVYALWEIEHFYYPRWGPSRPVQIDNETPRGLSLPRPVEPVQSVTQVDRTDRKPPKSPRENRNLNNNDGVHVVSPQPQDVPAPHNYSSEDTPDFYYMLDSQEKTKPQKKRKKKKDKKKLSFNLAPESESTEQEQEQVTEVEPETIEPEAGQHLYTDTYSLTPAIKDDKPAPSNGTASESSLNVSSLNDDEVQRELVPKPQEKADKPVHSDNVTPTPRSSRRRNASDRAAVPRQDPADLANTLRDIIRREMTRVMKAQYEGIMTGLGALDDGEDPPVSSGRKANKKRPQKHRERPHKAADDSEISTDFDVTPLPSDDPLSLTDLNQSPLKKKTEQSPPIRGALNELRHLENSHHHSHLSPGGALSYTYGTSQQTVIQVPQNKTQIQNQNPQQPYSTVLNMLGNTNPKLYESATASHPPLLRLPGPSSGAHSGNRGAQRIHFPVIAQPSPRVAWQARASEPNASMPFIQGPQYHPEEVPVRETAAYLPHTQRPVFTQYTPHSAQHGSLPGAGFFIPQQHSPSFRFPLLQMPGRQRTFTHIEDRNGTPRLVPLEELAAFEQHRAREEAQRIQKEQELRQRIAEIQPKSTAKSHRLEENQKSAAETSIVDDEEAMRTGVQVQPDTGVPAGQLRQEQQESEQESEQEDVDEESVQIHPGHALTPGLFDDYLEADPSVEHLTKETYADVQLKVVSMLKASKQARQEKRDTSIQTDPTLVHAGTTYSKDTGTDPVKEALDSYVRAKRELGAGGLLPPDIFMGLKFADRADPNSHHTESDNRRAYLNVVDLEGDAVDNIISHITGGEQSTQTGLQRAAEPATVTVDRTAVRQSTPSKDEDADRIPGPDSLTTSLLGHPPRQIQPVTADEIAKSARVKTKSTIRGRLDDMGSQIDAIESMAKRMEDDYKNTKLLVHTIESIGEAIDPLERLEPSARVLPPSHSPPTRDEQPFIASRGEVPPMKPSDVQRFNREDKEASTRVKSASQSAEDMLTPEERLKEIRAKLAMKPVERAVSGQHNISGLSGVSDIIQEAIANGDIDLAQAAVSHRSAKSEEKARESMRSEWSRLSREELEEQFDKQAGDKERRRTEEESRQLQEYIIKKRAERMRQFRQKRDALREHEVKPFQTAADSSRLSTKELEVKENQRLRDKMTREQDFAEKRRQLANKMMGDLLSDHLQLPPEPEVSPVKSSGRSRQTSPVKKAKSPVRGPKHSSPVRGHDLDRMEVYMDDYSHVRASQDYLGPSRDQKVRWSDETPGLDQTATDSFQGMYTRQLERMQTDTWDSSKDRPNSVRQQTKPSPIPEESEHSSAKVQTQAKPYTEVVRMQRPEVTRKEKGFPRKPQTYTERLSLMASKSPRSDQPDSARDKLYGTKRPVGAGAAGMRTAPRTVKTYTQRLQEMKQARQGAGITWQPRPVPRGASGVQRMVRQAMRSTTVRRKPGKPMTYQEQLQKLQPPKELYRTGQANMSASMRPVRRSHKPAHKPKTYAQQLQELQPPKMYEQAHTAHTAMPTVKRSMKSPIFRTSLNRGIMRSRPYSDPYNKQEEDEVSETSVLSAWDVDDNVRKLLYDDNEGMSVATTGADISDIAELEDLLRDDYTALVSINDLAEVGSMSSGSIMSYIDWDQVENLIADVY